MTPLERELLDDIAQRGPMPFAAFMSRALYDPRHGYYTRAHPNVGWRGDYVTSPELDPVFAHLWAGAFAQVWEGCGSPPRFDVVEVGPGEGTFADALLASARGPFADALQVHLVERSSKARERQSARLGDKVEWHGSLPEVPEMEAGCLFANEVLDNQPVHLVEMRNGDLAEVCVGADDGRLIEVLLPLEADEPRAFLERLGVELDEGQRFEIALASESFMRHCARVLDTGAIVLVDYGLSASELAERPAGTMLAYSSDGVDGEVLATPGERDITVHVNWTAIEQALTRSGWEPHPPRPQREMLARLGASEFDNAFKSTHESALESRDGATAVAALSRRQAIGALMDPSGLGALEVLVATRGITPPTWIPPPER